MQYESDQLVSKAKEIVVGSSISDKEKKLLLDRIPYAGTTLLTLFVDVCENDPFSLNILVKNLSAKLAAQGNLTKINEILKQERDSYSDLALAQ